MDLKKIYNIFPTEGTCLKYLEIIRWGSSPKCPYCNSENFSPLKGERRYHCNSCNTSFSATVGTIFHKTHVELQKWFLAVFIIYAYGKKGISVRKLAALLKVNKNTAHEMIRKVKEADAPQRAILVKILKAGTIRARSAKVKKAKNKGTILTRIKGILPSPTGS